MDSIEKQQEASVELGRALHKFLLAHDVRRDKWHTFSCSLRLSKDYDTIEVAQVSLVLGGLPTPFR